MRRKCPECGELFDDAPAEIDLYMDDNCPRSYVDALAAAINGVVVDVIAQPDAAE